MTNSGYRANYTYGLQYILSTRNPTSSDGWVECQLDVKGEIWPARVSPKRVLANAPVTLYVNVDPLQELSVKTLDNIEPQCFVRPDA